MKKQSPDSRIEDGSPRATSQNESHASQESEIIEQGDWIIIQSKKLGRPFFFNISNQSGQFQVPRDLADIPTNAASSIGASDDISSSQDHSTCSRSLRKLSRKSAPAQLEHVIDSGDSSGEDSSYTPTSKGQKRSRNGRRVASSNGKLRGSQSYAVGDVVNETDTRKQRQYIEIHEVEDDEDNEDESEASYIACQQCTYHNPLGSARCEICTAKLTSVTSTPLVMLPYISLSSSPGHTKNSSN